MDHVDRWDQEWNRGMERPAGAWGGRAESIHTLIHSERARTDSGQHATAECVDEAGTWCLEKPGRALEKELVSK